MNKIIKKVLSCCFIILLFVLSGQMVYADSVNQLEAQGAGQLVQIKENSEKKLEDYKEEYGSDAYGIAAYILNAVRIYSIPVCFVGIAIGGIYQVRMYNCTSNNTTITTYICYSCKRLEGLTNENIICCK